ncbi:hypothetical protein G6F56_005904 [Rhizopus delemar]|nr:hypothetical protein G6F56_005904 [Rhizopus delemar]
MSTSSESKKPILALPSTAEETVKSVDVNDTFKLNELGPVVINENGTMSRINNWHEMNDIERSNVNRILLKRNRERLARLKEAGTNAPTA